MLNVMNSKSTYRTLMCADLSPYLSLGCPSKNNMQFNVFVVWPCQALNRHVLLSYVHIEGHDGHVQLFPYAPRMFAFAVQIHVTLQSADTCIWCTRWVKVHIWWPCRYPITNLSITVTQGRGAGEDIHWLQHTWRHIAAATIPLTWWNAIMQENTQQFKLCWIHTNAKCFINVIKSLIQHDIHDWNLSQLQWAACCCIHTKIVSPRTLWIY